jgi:hypothetical protein
MYVRTSNIREATNVARAACPRRLALQNADACMHNTDHVHDKISTVVARHKRDDHEPGRGSMLPAAARAVHMCAQRMPHC